MESVSISLAFLGSGYFWFGLILGLIFGKLIVDSILDFLLRSILPGNV